jgi:hypothetical protein
LVTAALASSAFTAFFDVTGFAALLAGLALATTGAGVLFAAVVDAGVTAAFLEVVAAADEVVAAVTAGADAVAGVCAKAAPITKVAATKVVVISLFIIFLV